VPKIKTEQFLQETKNVTFAKHLDFNPGPYFFPERMKGSSKCPEITVSDNACAPAGQSLKESYSLFIKTVALWYRKTGRFVENIGKSLVQAEARKSLMPRGSMVCCLNTGENLTQSLHLSNMPVGWESMKWWCKLSWKTLPKVSLCIRTLRLLVDQAISHCVFDITWKATIDIVRCWTLNQNSINTVWFSLSYFTLLFNPKLPSSCDQQTIVIFQISARAWNKAFWDLIAVIRLTIAKWWISKFIRISSSSVTRESSGET